MSINYDSKTFTPDGSAQLWAVARAVVDGEPNRYFKTAPVVGWFECDENGTEYITAAVQCDSDPMSEGVQTIDDWATPRAANAEFEVKLIHVSQLAEELAK